MKKKVFLITSLCMLLFLGLGACGKTDPTTANYNGYTYEQLRNMAQGTIEALMRLSPEDRESYLAYGDESTINLINRWDEASVEIGDFVGFGEFSITKSGKTLTVDQIVNFEQRPVTVSFIYNYNSMQQEDVSVNPIQSLGEKMSNAGMNTVMGIVIVFAILACISLLIYAFKVIPYLMNKNRANVWEEAPKPVAIPPITEEKQDNSELIAVLAAAVAAATGKKTDDFVVRSIKRR